MDPSMGGGSMDDLLDFLGLPTCIATAFPKKRQIPRTERDGLDLMAGFVSQAFLALTVFLQLADSLKFFSFL